MDVKDLKLHIINRIIETEDPDLLQTILKILELNTPASALSEVAESLSKKLKNNSENQHIQILQQDINDVFEIK